MPVIVSAVLSVDACDVDARHAGELDGRAAAPAPAAVRDPAAAGQLGDEDLAPAALPDGRPTERAERLPVELRDAVVVREHPRPAPPTALHAGEDRGDTLLRRHVVDHRDDAFDLTGARHCSADLGGG